MVVFTCNNCGESLRKQKVAQHYMTRCRRKPNLSCVDCFKDFLGNEYEKHTECITEVERYGDKSNITVPKHAKKQKEWLNVVENVLNTDKSLSKDELNFLNLLLKHKNIPRKKSKFENFVKCAMGCKKINPKVINSVWDKLAAYKSDTQSDNAQNEKQQENGKTDEKVDDEKDVSMHQENNIVENQNNENIDREKQNGDREGVNGIQNGTDGKKKSKKRTASETGQEETEAKNDTEEPITKKKKKKHASTEETVSSEKKEDISESSINQGEANLTFNWKDTILSTVKSKGEISLKKLQDKVISRYMNFSSDTVSREKACSKFNKKLKKVSEIIVSDEKVRLA